jgi:hypothetical protein
VAQRIAVVTFNAVHGPQDTLKYQCLGVRAVAALKVYAARHGYGFHACVPDLNKRDICWAKIPAILQALESNDWVLWVDSDALIALPQLPIETFLDFNAAIVAQSPEPWFDLIGLRHSLGWKLQPVNTGVFLIQSCEEARRLLTDTYALSIPATAGMRWNGRGDQEALASVLARDSQSLFKVRYVNNLQRPPQRSDLSALFIHLYGNYGRFRFPEIVCQTVIENTFIDCEEKNSSATVALLHWCAIQNRDPENPFDRGGPERFGYSSQVIDIALHELMHSKHICFD